MAKGKAIIIVFFIFFGLNASSQNEPMAEKMIEKVEIPDLNTLNSGKLLLPLLSLKKVDPISEDPKDQNKSIHYGKSQEIISVKAYIRKLHMKRNETLMS